MEQLIKILTSNFTSKLPDHFAFVVVGVSSAGSRLGSRPTSFAVKFAHSSAIAIAADCCWLLGGEPSPAAKGLSDITLLAVLR